LEKEGRKAQYLLLRALSIQPGCPMTIPPVPGGSGPLDADPKVRVSQSFTGGYV
jgi:hypothetical protein